MNETLGYIIILIGVIFNFFGCLGLVRFPDIYDRLQAATKCVTLGTCSIVLGVILISGLSATGIKGLLLIVFVVLTSPAGAHALARAAHKSGVRLWERSVCDKYEEDGK